MLPQSFGPFILDPDAGRLLRDGNPVELRPQALHALYSLAKNAGTFVGYEQMLREAWNGTAVSKHTVAVTVGEVKRALGEQGGWIGYRQNLGYCLTIPRSDDTIRMAVHCSNRQTQEGLRKARATFVQATREDPSDPRAWEGLAQACLMLGTYGMEPPRDIYREVLDALDRAAGLIGWTPELRGDRAQGWHVFERRFAAAETELLEVVRLRPRLGPTYVRLAMLYATTGRTEEALEVIEHGHRADPILSSLPGAELFIHICRNDSEAAIREGQAAVELHPYVPLVRVMYAAALGMERRWNQALDQLTMARASSPDLTWLRAIEGACLAAAGDRDGALRAVEEIERARQTLYVDAYFVALLYDALDDLPKAFAEMERALDEQSATLFLLKVDPRIQCLRRHPRFAELCSRAFGTASVGA